jgi:sugar fermentation stimulation protein A
VTLSRRPGLAEWPDCVSSRSSRQLAVLADAVADGLRAVILFVVQRSDCTEFAVAADLDPAFNRALADAQARGVEVLVYGCEVGPGGLELGSRLSIL